MQGNMGIYQFLNHIWYRMNKQEAFFIKSRIMLCILSKY